MKFLYPQFLWALTALSIPLIIHLFNFRRYTTIYFSNTRFLQNVVKQSKSINRLRQLLIMLARMLALAMLVIAFANPYLPSQNALAESANYATLYIDNSPSMLSGEEQNSQLSKARTQAVEIIKGLPGNYHVQVLTNDFQGRQQRFYSKAEAIDLVDAITPSYAFRESIEIVEKIKQVQQKESDPALEVFWLSDFQSTAFAEDISVPENWRQTILPFRPQENIGNIAIDSAWFEAPVLQPGFDQELQVHLSNSGSEDNRKVAVNLSLDGKLQGAREIDIPAGRKATATFTLRADEARNFRGEISVDAGNPYFDNQFFFTYRVDRPFQILLTGNPEFREKFRKLYSDSIYRLTYSDLQRIDYSTLQNYDLIILDAAESVPSGFVQAIRENLNNSRNVVLIPSAKDPEGVNNVLSNLGLPPLGAKKPAARALDVSWNDPHFKNVFNNTPEKPALPNSEEHFEYSASTGYPLVRLEDGSPLVSRIPVGTGSLLLFTANLQKTDISSHPIFVPLMLNAVLYSRTNSALYTLAGKAQGPSFQVKEPGETPMSIKVEDRELIPRQRNRNQTVELYDLSPELKPGIYEVIQNDKPQGYIALNAPPAESRWSFLSDEEISSRFGLESSNILEADASQVGFSISQRYNGISLWKWFLAAALLFLVVEIILIKLWK